MLVSKSKAAASVLSVVYKLLMRKIQHAAVAVKKMKKKNPQVLANNSSGEIEFFTRENCGCFSFEYKKNLFALTHYFSVNTFQISNFKFIMLCYHFEFNFGYNFF